MDDFENNSNIKQRSRKNCKEGYDKKSYRKKLTFTADLRSENLTP